MKTEYPIYDKRDGAKDASLQFQPIRKILGLPWNRGVERSLEHCQLDHSKALETLKRRAKKAGETILAAVFDNYAVTILVEN
jgi:hypothetical protein